MALGPSAWAAYGAMVVGWTFTLGGLSAVTDSKLKFCEDFKTGFPDDEDLAKVLFFQCTRNVNELNRFYWFVWALELVAIVGVLLSVSSVMWYRLKVGVTGVLCILATLNIIQTNSLITMIGSQLVDGEEETKPPGLQLLRTKITLTGFAISALANILLAFFLGAKEGDRIDTSPQKLEA